LDNCYTQDFEAIVTSVIENKFIILDNTAFYPNSGGQPNDTGTLTRKSDGKIFKVIFVGKFEGKISHQIQNSDLEPDDEVIGRVDWDRRLKLMRFHTAAHILSAVIRNETGARITGNQKEEEKARIDFDLEKFDKAKMEEYVEKANKIIKKNIQIKKYFMKREEALNNPDLFSLKNVVPPDENELRIVEIGDFDVQACGGCHVDNTSEIGKLKFLKAQNKGKNNRRVYFTFA